MAERIDYILPSVLISNETCQQQTLDGSTGCHINLRRHARGYRREISFFLDEYRVKFSHLACQCFHHMSSCIPVGSQSLNNSNNDHISR
ncbi:hypothetical protein B7P43_G04204 [Cryptotermes secundus]|uniref:Uncharacterized protein n=1 Tax=Cryptotermes secundus TaxID=105785 RepID=A0A2J7PKQ6_9NEOP|nr:hypothetical protein B7P43_G04204 [Cryptotermes secundus]